MTPKERTAAAAKRLRDAAKLQDPMAQSAIELIALMAEEAKERLVAASGEDMLREQGAARELRRIVRELTTEPPSLAKI